MQTNQRTILRQMMDWRAAIIAGIVAGVVFVLLNMWLASYYLGNANLPLQLSAAVVLGPSVLPPAIGVGGSVYAAGFTVHMLLAIAFVCLIAFCLHRWGILVGIIGGALFGLALYAINYYSVADAFPWFAPLRGWIMALSHVVFGAIGGGVYEALERDRFEQVHI